ncbi:uncharacterized protein LOC112347705 [Selaginella moellendorffii]|uniref:uncharacterized protein LOC112347705 n=1 Tax=Selaginella moellendorffii TaxID=88036 RepID=UPI000D1D0708|nr:uncharacterized protein LOC112347705 [Selaginella moellendorffii]|eukprot:XP_024534803.1 uncharacterized protein LOC112347705 [Selaginella moellendorffii]
MAGYNAENRAPPYLGAVLLSLYDRRVGRLHCSVSCAKNFPKNQGMVLSLLDSTQGLSVTIFSRSNDSFILFLLLAWFPSLLCLLFAFVIRSLPLDIGENALRLLVGNFDPGWISHGDYHPPAFRAPRILDHQGLLFIMLLILSFPAIQIPQVDHQDGKNVVNVDPLDHGANAAAPTISSIFSKGLPVKRGDDFTILQALCSIDMLLIFAASTCGIGAVLTVTNNFGQIGSSLGNSQARTNTFIALLSIWDFIGGVGRGFISDTCLASYGVARPFFLCLVLLLLSLGSLIIALGLPGFPESSSTARF